MRLLVTRPEPDASELAERLAGLGHEPVIEPLTTIRPASFVLPNQRFAAIVLTSRHGVAALAAAGPAVRDAGLFELPAWCVGTATAAAARAAGFAKAKSGGDNARTLAAAIIDRRSAAAGRLLYARGQDVSSDLAGRLAAAGFAVTEIVVYAAPARERLSAAVHDMLAARAIGGVVLMSARAAAIFARLVESEGLASAIAGRTAFCLSSAIAEKLSDLDMRVAVAARPDLNALITVIGDHSAAPA